MTTQTTLKKTMTRSICILSLTLTAAVTLAQQQPKALPSGEPLRPTDQFVEDCLANLDNCLATKRHQIASTASMGAEVLPWEDAEGHVGGIQIMGVEPGGAADKGGLEAGDIFKAWAGQAITEKTVDTFFNIHRSLTQGQSITYQIDRGGKLRRGQGLPPHQGIENRRPN